MPASATGNPQSIAKVDRFVPSTQNPKWVDDYLPLEVKQSKPVGLIPFMGSKDIGRGGQVGYKHKVHQNIRGDGNMTKLAVGRLFFVLVVVVVTCERSDMEECKGIRIYSEHMGLALRVEMTKTKEKEN